LIEQYDQWPTTKMSHLSITYSILDEVTNMNNSTTDIVSIEQYFQQNVSEIIVIVEGIEPTISGSFSAMQSYRYEDIVFERNAYFRPCIRKRITMRNHNQHEDHIMTSSPGHDVGPATIPIPVSATGRVPSNESFNDNRSQITYVEDSKASSSLSRSTTPTTPATLQIDLDCFHGIDYDIIPMITSTEDNGTSAGRPGGGAPSPLSTTGIQQVQQQQQHQSTTPRMKKQPREQQQSLRYHDSFFASSPKIIVPSGSHNNDNVTDMKPYTQVVEKCDG
jgi:hypothetical protein